jgi:hypothetical protein
MEGFSANNVWRMRAFYLACREFRSLPQPVAEKAAQKPAQPAQEIPSPILAQAAQELPPPELTMIPWYHNVLPRSEGGHWGQSNILDKGGGAT